MTKSLQISIASPDRRLIDKARKILSEPQSTDQRSNDVRAICREFVSIAEQLQRSEEELRRAGGR